jgi:NADH-quinone oxidoreductase chain G
MSTVPSSETVRITINDVEIEVPKGELVIESVKRLGFDVPIFCYHPRMVPVGMCRMCFVEVGFKQPDGSVKKMPKPQTACTLPASEGMVVYTDTEQIHKDRKGILEFLLINHPLDCPICDRGGECPLQNNTLFYGPSTSRYIEIKRHLPKAYPLSKYVTLDLERCIQCGRCVRFTEEISGDSQLAFRFRGAMMQPSTFQMTDFESKFSGNTIEICPVGALTSTHYRFRARPWDLETKHAICTLCSNGCNIWFDYRAGKFVRINGRTHEGVNEEWTCDKGKFGHDFYNSPKRLSVPLLRQGDAFRETGWAEAYEEILKAFAVGGHQVAALIRATFSNEGLYNMQKLFRAAFKSNNLDYRWTRFPQKAEDRLDFKAGIPQVQSSIASYESQKNILIWGTSLADEEPILYLRVRKAWFKNQAKVFVAHPTRTDADSFAQEVLRYKSGTEALVAACLLRLVAEKTSKEVPESLRILLARIPLKNDVQEIMGTSLSSLDSLAEAFCAEPGAVITTRNLMNSEQGQVVLDLLGGVALLTDSAINCYSLSGNGQGAEDLGFLPDMLPGGRKLSDERARKELEELWGTEVPEEPGECTYNILKRCAEGKIKALWVVNADPVKDFYDRELAIKALENVEFLVYQGFIENETMPYASVVLPMRAPAEQDGSYTNLERRVQRMQPIVAAPGISKSSWRIFSELMLRHSPTTPHFGAKEVMEEIGRVVPWYAEAVYENLWEEGVLLNPQKPSKEPSLDYLVRIFTDLREPVT